MKCQISVTDIQIAGYISTARASNTQLFCNFYDNSVYRPSCFYCNHSTSCSYSFYSAPCIYSYNSFIGTCIDYSVLAGSTDLMTFFCFSTVSFDINNSFPEMTAFFGFVSMSSFSRICVEYSLSA